MDIGNRLRSVREEKNLSQGDIEQRTRLLRCYISRVENGHTVPAIETARKNGASVGDAALSAYVRRSAATCPTTERRRKAVR